MSKFLLIALLLFSVDLYAGWGSGAGPSDKSRCNGRNRPAWCDEVAFGTGYQYDQTAFGPSDKARCKGPNRPQWCDDVADAGSNDFDQTAFMGKAACKSSNPPAWCDEMKLEDDNQRQEYIEKASYESDLDAG